MEYVPKHTTEYQFFKLMVFNFCNGICDLFAMVLECSVMVLFLLFFLNRVASLFLYNAF